MATVNQNEQSSVPSSTSVSKVRRETIEKAVRALLKWKEVQSKSQKPQLLPEDEFLYLVLSLKKIPPKSTSARTNPHKIPLPNPLVLHDDSSSELCLIIDDRPSSKLTSELAKQKIKSDGVPVSKVLRLSKLKTDYKAFEAKRKLCDSYDLFFADKRVVTLLPKLLGKQFFKKRKLPLPVDLTHKNWKEQINRACCSALLYLRTGTCSVVRVGRVSMERDEIVENVSAAIDGIVEFVPKKWAGVRSLHLKFSESVPLPVYQALPDMKLKIQGVVNKDETVSGGEIVVKKDDKSGSRKKGRIHEVRYMDDATTAVTTVSEDDELGSEGESDDDIGSAVLVSKKRNDGVAGKEEVVNDDTGSAGKKKRKGNSLKKEVVSKNNRKQAKKITKEDDELGSEGESDDDIGSAVLVSKKRNDGVAGKEEVVNDDTGSAGKKRRKGNSLKKEVVSKNNRKQAKKITKEDDELGSEGESDDGIGSAELVSKKRKNGVTGKVEVVNDDTGSAGKKKRKGDSLKKEAVSNNNRKQAKKTTKGDNKEEEMKGASTLTGSGESGKKGKKKGDNGTTLKVKKSKKLSAV